MRVIGILLLLCTVCSAQLPRRVVQDMKRATGSGGSSWTNVTDGLIVYYKFNEGTGTKVSNFYSATNNGVFAGAGHDPVWVSGFGGNPYALAFDGNDASYVKCTNDVAFGSTNFTYCLWFKRANSSFQRLCGGGFRETGMFVNDVSPYASSVVWGAGPLNSSGSDIPTNVWTHLIGAWDHSLRAGAFYTNGVFCNSGGATNYDNLHACTASRVGSPSYSGGTTGAITAFRFYNRKIDSTEAQHIYHYDE